MLLQTRRVLLSLLKDVLEDGLRGSERARRQSMEEEVDEKQSKGKEEKRTHVRHSLLNFRIPHRPRVRLLVRLPRPGRVHRLGNLGELLRDLFGVGGGGVFLGGLRGRRRLVGGRGKEMRAREEGKLRVAVGAAKTRCRTERR